MYFLYLSKVFKNVFKIYNLKTSYKQSIMYKINFYNYLLKKQILFKMLKYKNNILIAKINKNSDD